MGFSPGEFMTGGYPERPVHWEGEDNWIVLWNDDESETILMLTHQQAIIALRQLRTAIYAVTGEDPV
jgi:hypothetical protein